MFTVLLIFAGLVAAAQQVLTEYFQLNDLISDDYALSPQNFDLEQDSLGRIYMANGTGILIFEGNRHYMVRGSENLTFRSLIKDLNGRIYAAGMNQLGYLASNDMGEIGYFSLYQYIEDQTSHEFRITDLIIHNEILFFKSGTHVGQLKDTLLTEWEFESPNLIFQVFEDKIITQNENGELFNLSDGHLESVSLPTRNKVSPLLKGIIPLEKDKNLLISREEGLWRMENNEISQLQNDATRILSKTVVKSILVLPDGIISIGTAEKGVIFVNSWGEVTDQLYANNGLINENVYFLYLDMQNNLWMGHDNGFSKTEYPFLIRYYGEEQGLNGIILTMLEDKDYIYVGTLDGLFYNNPNESSHFTEFPETREIWDIKAIGNNIIAASSFGIHFIEKNKIIKTLDINARYIMPTAIEDIVLVGIGSGLGKLKKEKDQWIWDGEIEGIDHESRFIIEENDSTFWLSHEKISKVVFSGNLQDVLETMTCAEEQGVQGDFYQVELVYFNGRVHFATQNGFLIYDKESKQIVKDSLLNNYFWPYERETFAPMVDPEGKLWITSKRSTGPLLPLGNQTFLWDTLALHRLKNTDVWKMKPGENGSVWLCTTDGLYLYDSNLQKTFDTSYPAIINRIYINQDSLIFFSAPRQRMHNQAQNEPIVLPFQFNNLLLNFDANSFHINEHLMYSYILDGFDEKWSVWSEDRKKEYTRIPAGDYMFKVIARNFYGIESKEAAFKFTVLPPWYQTWWAYGGYFLLFVGLLFGLDRYQRKRIHKKQVAKIRMQEKEIEREKEISSKLRNVDRLKDEFLAHTSHDLRTPLHGIIGISESIVDQVEGMSADEIKKNLAMVTSSGKRLSSMVDSILDYSRIKAKDLDLKIKNVDLHAISDLVLNMSQPMISKKKIQLINSIPGNLPYVRADENRLQQILFNLVGNAIKFTESGSIQVEARVIDRKVEVKVSDTGIGIPEEKAKIIFESFEQLDLVVDREYIGTGLGLTITKKLVELHKGDIWVESEVNKGSTFYFTLPVNDSKAKSPESDTSQVIFESDEFALKKETVEGEFKILIVDDEPVNQQVLVNHLHNENYNVEVAANGLDALDLVHTQKFDLILLDVMMPGMSGFEVSKKIRERYPLNELPIIFVTSKDQIGDLVEGLSFGGNDYIAKPFSKEELLARVKTHLNLYKINDSYARFIPHEFLESLGRDTIMDVHLGDQTEKEVTIFFTDIRGYTALAEGMSPTENFVFLNDFLGIIGPVIRKNRGFILHYLGDGLMALFLHAPSDSVKASLQMQKRLCKFNRKRIKEGKEEILMGTGMHTGNLILGVLGDKKRMDANVVSDAVNTASRMEGLTQIYGSSIIVSEDTILRIKKPDFNYRLLGIVLAKGKARPVKIYELLNGKLSTSNKYKIETKKEFEKGLDHYYNKEFVEAASCFKNILRKNEEDKAAALYLKLSAQYMVSGVSENWDGTEPVTG